MKFTKEKNGSITIGGLAYDQGGRDSYSGKTKLHLNEKTKIQLDDKEITVTVLAYSRKK